MSQEQGLGISRLDLFYISRVDRIMARTEAVVEDKMLVRDLRRHVMSQIPVRRKENMLVRQLPDNLDGIRRSDADIGHGLDGSRRIDVADDGQIIILGTDFFNRLYVAIWAIGQLAVASGMRTFFSGLSILALSPIKSTPAKTMTLASVSIAFLPGQKNHRQNLHIPELHQVHNSEQG